MELSTSWKEISETLLYDGYRKIYGRGFLLPDGRSKTFDVLKTPNVVCCLPVGKDGRFLLTKQFRPGPNRELIVPPGGAIDFGESPELACARELAEETGYSGRLVFLSQSVQDGYATGLRSHFLVMDCDPVAAKETIHKDPDEFIELIWLTKEELLKEIYSGNVSDAETCLLALYAIERGRHLLCDRG